MSVVSAVLYEYRYILFCVETVMSIIAFFLYALDKHRARAHKWRIPESTLIMFAALFGAPGAAAGMVFCHHKTKHTKFIVTVPLFLILQIALFISILLHNA